MDKEESKDKAKELALATIRGLISWIPGAGGLMSEWFGQVVASPIAKRRDEWVRSIEERVRAIEKDDPRFSAENLKNNKIFATAVLAATQVALRNHQEEKIAALRNGVINSVTSDIEEDKKLMFFNVIDLLTPTHLKILRFFDNPNAWLGKSETPLPKFLMAGHEALLEYALPEFRGQGEFYNQILKELHAHGLTSTPAIHNVVASAGFFHSITTLFGKEFLKFVEEK